MPRPPPPSRAPAALLCMALLLAMPAAAADRPRIGLVLGGGGARGAAHIGVLEVLERLRVPVDCVAGTSMGALVAGAWAAGLTPATMRLELAAANWTDLFLDNPDYTELNYRNKRLSQRFLPGSESGVTADGLVAPPGVVAGQKIKLFFNRLVRADEGERDIARLPLPVSIIATDIGTGERVVFREGSLTQAMRASMAVPGLLAPLTYAGRKLVDGGLVDNVPVREVRERCGAEVVIAVNVGSPLLKADDVTGLLSISAQMVGILTEQNVSQSLATLTSRDIYIKPDLTGISAADFARSGEAADRGHAAAERAADALARLALPPAEFAAWQRRLDAQPANQDPVDEIQIAGLKRVNPQTVQRYLAQRAGQPLDSGALDRDLLRAYGDGHYENVDYALLNERDRRVLRITPVEKRWGPDYLRFALNLESNLGQGSTYALRLGYQKTWLNHLGGELLFVGELGSTTGASAEWYQPLDGVHRSFVSAGASSRRERGGVYQDDQRVAELGIGTSQIDLTAGLNLGLLGQVRAGWRELRLSISLQTGLPGLNEPTLDTGGWQVSLDLDQLDRLYFPTRGWALRAGWFDSASPDYAKVQVDGRLSWPLGQWVLGARAAYTGAVHGRLPAADAGSLGGFQLLSGFAPGQFIGDDIRFLQLRAERIVGRLPLGLRGDMRLGLSLEAGKIGRPLTETQRSGWLDSVLLYLGGETPIGPVYAGFGHSSRGSSNAYLFIGTP